MIDAIVDSINRQERLKNCSKIILAKLWMTERGCCVLTNPQFKPTNAENTNVRETFRKLGFTFKTAPFIDELELEGLR